MLLLVGLAIGGLAPTTFRPELFSGGSLPWKVWATGGGSADPWQRVGGGGGAGSLA